MKKYLLILVSLFSIAVLSSAKPGKVLRQVRFSTSIDCSKCVQKVTENISFEKGVKDLEANLADKEVKVVYDAAKTDTLTLAKAIRKLGYEAKVIEDKAL